MPDSNNGLALYCLLFKQILHQAFEIIVKPNVKVNLAATEEKNTVAAAFPVTNL